MTAVCQRQVLVIQYIPQRQRVNTDLNPIRRLIRQAQLEDAHSSQLLAFVERRRRALHAAIKLPPEQASARLAEFVQRYVCHVPDFIEAVSSMAREAGIAAEVEPLLKIASDYFLSPPSLVNGQSQLEALLDEAYLAHRLLEEVNDRFMAQSGIPLAPMDMTMPNIIAHELIGEPFANELDQAVLFSAELLLNEHRLDGENLRRYVHRHREEGWHKELARWPCLQADLAIAVEFGEPPEVWH